MPTDTGPQRQPPTLNSLPRPVFSRHEALAAGAWTAEHSHPWGQLSYASQGVLGVRTPAGDHMAPPRFAVWTPPGVRHQLFNRRRAQMHSLYIAPEASILPAECCVLQVSPLARESDSEPGITDRFELFVGGKELANGFSELNDPEDQAARFRAQVEAKEGGDDEAMHFDADYIRALEVGLAPTGGLGVGIDRFVMLLTGSSSIRDVLLFPYMRPGG